MSSYCPYHEKNINRDIILTNTLQFKNVLSQFKKDQNSLG